MIAEQTPTQTMAQLAAFNAQFAEIVTRLNAIELRRSEVRRACCGRRIVAEEGATIFVHFEPEKESKK
jgi:hypothetical protein